MSLVGELFVLGHKCMLLLQPSRRPVPFMVHKVIVPVAEPVHIVDSLAMKVERCMHQHGVIMMSIPVRFMPWIDMSANISWCIIVTVTIMMRAYVDEQVEE